MAETWDDSQVLASYVIFEIVLSTLGQKTILIEVDFAPPWNDTYSVDQAATWDLQKTNKFDKYDGTAL